MAQPALSRDLERKIILARIVLFWERFWPALLPLLLVLGAIASIALFGLFMGFALFSTQGGSRR